MGPKSTIHVVFGRRKIAKPPVTSPLPEVLATSLAEPPEPLEEAEETLDDDWVDVTQSTTTEDVVESSSSAEKSVEDVEAAGQSTNVTPGKKKKVVTFYVLCSFKACPGKLRVRCSLCKEGKKSSHK